MVPHQPLQVTFLAILVSLLAAVPAAILDNAGQITAGSEPQAELVTLSSNSLAATITANAGWKEVGTSSASAGGISNSGISAQAPSVAIGLDSLPYIAWSDYPTTGDNEIYVRHWNGTVWEEVRSGSASGGGISNNDGLSWFPRIAIGPSGAPYVTWFDLSPGDSEIYVRRWNGASWEEVGAGSALGGGISDNSGASEAPALTITPDGVVYVAWHDDSSSNHEIYVRRWNGNNWEEVGAGSGSGGGISNNAGSSYTPSLAHAPDGTVYVAWDDTTSGDSEIYVRRWNGSSWEEVGTGSATGGGISNDNGSSVSPSVAVAPSGTVYIAWADSSGGNSEIYVRRWTGSTWEEVGAGSASGGGISNSTGTSGPPSIGIRSDGTPYVSWEDASSGNQEIYVRRWIQGSWQEVGVGSASDGGISSNSGESWWSWLAIGPDGMPYVAWHDRSSGRYEIYVRRWENEPDLGFRPDANGFQFANKQLSRSWEMFEQFFSSGNVTKADGQRCKEAENYFENEYRMAANGWSCLGFSQASLHSYMNWAQPNAGSFAMGHYEQLYQQPESNQITDPIAYYAGVQTARQWGDEYHAWQAACSADPSQMLEAIRQSLVAHDPVVVSLAFNPPTGWHTLAPYRIDEISPTAANVYVYDSEQPGQERAIHFQETESGWQWQYAFVGSVGGAGARTGRCEDIYPYSLRTGLQQGIPPINFCESSSAQSVQHDSADLRTSQFSTHVLAQAPVQGDWEIEDSMGRRVGWVNGEFISEIPDAYVIPEALGDAVLTHRTLFLPVSDYTLRVSNAPSQTTGYTAYRDGGFLEVRGELQSAGGPAELGVSSGLTETTLTAMQNLRSFSLSIDDESSTESRVFTLTSPSFTGSDDVDVSFDGDQVVVSRTGGELQYWLSFEKSDGQSFESVLLTLGANETDVLTPVDWASVESTDVLLEIDQGSDGIVDETRLLKNIHRIYLPVIIRG